MDKKLKQLRLRQTEAKLRPWMALAADHHPTQGWVRTIRQAIGMTSTQLASRLGVTRQAIAELEKREAEGSVTLAALEKAAAALNCDVVYALVPRQELSVTIREQARKRAEETLGKVAHTMRLESQDVEPDELRRQVEDVASDWTSDWSRSIWDSSEGER